MHFRELVAKVGARLTTVEDAITSSSKNIVVLAVPKDFYEKQPLHLLEGKIVIDVSNRNSIYRKGDERSQAEYLQSLLPRSAVVKVSFFKTFFFFFFIVLPHISGFQCSVGLCIGNGRPSRFQRSLLCGRCPFG